MNEQLQVLLTAIKTKDLPFSKVLGFIDTFYQHQPTAFKNGDTYNQANQNQGSAHVFAFAQINGLSAEDTLWLFAEHYRSVLDTPDAVDDQNIRQFMAHGWNGMSFEGQPLIKKQ